VIGTVKHPSSSSTLPHVKGRVDACGKQTLSTEATAWAHKVDRTYWKLWPTSIEETSGYYSKKSMEWKE